MKKRAPDGQAGGGQQALSTDGARPHSTTQPVALAIAKRGRHCTIGKVVMARPLGLLVLAMPYRHRQTVDHVSLPPAVLAYARQAGARAWVVRLDARGECFALPLADVERLGWLQASDGRAEWFIPLSRFTPVPWQDWPFVTRTVLLSGVLPPSGADARQLGLFGGAA